MAVFKKVMISLPEHLLKEVDLIVTDERINRSEFVREAMHLYIKERKKIELRNKMKNGYQEMAEINSKLAEICHKTDNEQQHKYEDRLGELEKLW